MDLKTVKKKILVVFSLITFKKRHLLLFLFSIIALFILLIALLPKLEKSDRYGQSSFTLLKPFHDAPNELVREALMDVFEGFNFNTSIPCSPLFFEKGGERLKVNLTINEPLQKYIQRLLRHSQTIKAAVVVMNPNDGRILAMTNYQKIDGVPSNFCLQADFPAASIIKIITAAAAIEKAGYTPSRKVFFRGRRYTLYKNQLNDKKSRYDTRLSFRKAFAFSINPVFGKLGIYDLGHDIIAEYAGRFFFNMQIPFDLPVAVSTLNIPEDAFGLAELASGFNKQTLISPLHAALLVSSVANHGMCMVPRLTEDITDESGKIIYKCQPKMLDSPINRGTAKDLKDLMHQTILYGTCRQAFRNLLRKKKFKKITIGGKTGTINDKANIFKFDWTVAYMVPQDRSKSIAVAVLSIHGKKLGIRASMLASSIINNYMKN